MKKILTAILLLTLLLSLFAAPMVFAEDDETTPEYEYTVNDGGSCTITRYNGTETDVVIPSKIDGHLVTKIGTTKSGWLVRGAFQNRGLTSVTIPSSVKEIEEYAFRNNLIETITCSNFDSIIFGEVSFNNNQITTINGEPSDGCILDVDGTTIISYGGAARDVVDFPESATAIGERAFTECGITSVVIPSNIIEIGETAFSYNNIRTLEFEEGIQFIYERAFFDNNISKVTLPNSLLYIGNDLFYLNPISSHKLPDNGYGWLQTATWSEDEDIILAGGAKVTVERGRTNIVYYSLAPVTLDETMCEVVDNGDGTCTISRYSGKGLNIIIPDKINELTVTGIESGVFTYKPITSVVLPDTITYIGYGAFNNSKITTVNGQPSNGLFYKKNADGTDDLTTIVSYGGASTVIDFIPATVTVIAESAFSNCNLTKVTIPDNVKQIEDRAFQYNYDLSRLELSEHLMFIGDTAFYECNLNNIKLPDSLLYLGHDVFGSWDETKKINVTLPASNSPWLVINEETGSSEEIEKPEYVNAFAYAATSDYSDIDNSLLYETEEFEDGTCQITKIYVYNTDLVFPNEINNHTVTTLGNLELHNKYLKSITFPDTLVYVSTQVLGYEWTGTELKDLLPATDDGWTEVEESWYKYYINNSPVSVDSGDLEITDYGNGTCSIDKYLGIYTNLILPSHVDGLRVTDINCSNLHSKLLDGVRPSYGVIFPNTDYNWTDGSEINYTAGSFYGKDELLPVVVFADEDRELSAADVTIADNGDGTCTIQEYKSAFTSIIIPKTIDDLQVTDIGDNAFKGKALESVIFSGTIVNVGANAFSLNNLTEITFSEGLKTIGESAFYSNSLVSIELPDSLEFIGDLAFNNNNVETINRAKTDGLIYAYDSQGKQIKSTIISYCGSETVVDFIPESVTTIKANVFADSDITEIILPTNYKGWIDDAGEVYIFNPTILDRSSSYSLGDKFYFNYFMQAIWEKALDKPIIIVIASAVLLLPLLAWMLISSAKSKKKLKDKKITEEKYKKIKKRRLIISIIIAVLIAAACVFFVFFYPISFNTDTAEQTTNETSEENNAVTTEQEEAESMHTEDFDYEYDFEEMVIFDADIITLTDSIADLSEIEERTELESVDLSNVSGQLTSLSNLVNLQSLKVNNGNYYTNNPTGDLSDLRNLINLRMLSISNYDYSGEDYITGNLSSLSGMTKLESLFIYGNNISGDLSDLSGMTNLKEIFFMDANITGDLSILEEMTDLQSVYFANCHGITGDIASLEGLENLKTVGFTLCNGITGDMESLSSLDNLNTLYLQEMQNVTGYTSAISELKNLVEFNISGSANISGDFKDFRSLTSLSVLSMSLDGFVGDLNELDKLPKLDYLSLHSTSNSYEISELSGCFSLDSLKLEGNGFTGDISSLTSLINLTELVMLDCENLLGDISELNTLSQLFHLYLASCHNITGDISTLTELNNLFIFTVYNCENITGSLTVKGQVVTANE